ncbi:MAG: hypothetical protein QOE13_2273 [Gaiellaceae bacterium]|nr:hypothetical protein [Gaiellaceae bacterium]
MDTYDWLIFLHVTGAFLVLGGAVMAGIFNFAALRRERPSEVAVLFRLAKAAVTAISVGMVLTLGFGLWLVHDVGYGWGQTWIILSLVLWVLANALGGVGGRREKQTRELAERLAAEGDAPSTELSSRLHDPVWLALSWGSGVVIVVILALMIWKPGA